MGIAKPHEPLSTLPPKPTTDQELQQVTEYITGIRIPSARVCPGHQPDKNGRYAYSACSPLDAFAHAYFARDPISVWYASRGLGGKSMMLAALAMMEAIYLPASVCLLGGSVDQSARVYGYMTGDDTTLPNTFWKSPNAPLYLLESDFTRRILRLINGIRLRVLAASAKSVRSPHVPRLRVDEVDEMTLKLLDDAMGITTEVESTGVEMQTVLSSTYHNAGGTMETILERADQNNWPVFCWCYRENLVRNGGWLGDRQVEKKRNTVTFAMWTTEYEVQRPSPGSFAIMTDSVETMFSESMGKYAGDADELLIFEEPQPGGKYAVGADWARDVDWTIVVVLRIDVKPARLVAFLRTGRAKWTNMVGDFDALVKRYKLKRRPAAVSSDGKPIRGTKVVAGHDATGIGNVIDDYTASDVVPYVLNGKLRHNILTGYIKAIEGNRIRGPRIEWMYREHRRASRKAVYGDGHLPDTICAGAIAYYVGKTLKGKWSMGPAE